MVPVTSSRPFRAVTETPLDGVAVPLLVHPEWAERHPWLCQGTTTGGSDGDFDLGLFGPSPSSDVQARWDLLSAVTGFPRVVHGRQVHGTTVGTHGPGAPGRALVSACDGHVTAQEGTLLTVATADCVPVSVVSPERRAVALLHAGWRGVAAGVLEAGLDRLRALVGAGASLEVHLGPAICGRCYEVGPEVHQALGLPDPGGPLPVDLREVLADRALARGVASDGVTVSTHCTRCGDAGLFSHRAGHRGRQLGVLGIRPAAAGTA